MKRLFPFLAAANTWLGIPIGLLSAWYFYALSITEVDPCFVVDPQRTVVVERARLSDAPVRLVRADGTPVRGDVSSFRVYFWNAGKKPVVASDVLDPLRVTVTGLGEILDFKVKNATRPAVTRSEVTRAPGTLDSLEIGFRILEQNDGLAIQLLVAGDVNTTATLGGTIVGARQFTTTGTIARSRSWVGYVRATLPLVLLWSLSALTIGVSYAVTRAELLNKQGDQRTWVHQLARCGALARRFGKGASNVFMLVMAVALLVSIAESAEKETQRSVTEVVPAELSR